MTDDGTRVGERRGGTGEPGVLVEADLVVETPGSSIRVRGGGDSSLYVEAPSLGALRSFLRNSRGRRLAAHLEPRLSTPVVFRVRGVPVLRFDATSESGTVSRLLGVAPARIDLLGVVRSVLPPRHAPFLGDD